MTKIQIFVYEIKKSWSEEKFANALHTLPEFMQKIILEYKHRQTAMHSLVGKLLLNYAIKKMSLSFDLHDVKMTSKGRPYTNGKIDFNIAHSGSWVVLAIAENRIGIDIEKHRIIEVDLFRKYFSDEEWGNIQKNENPGQQFFDYWAIKESAIKCNGKGVEVLGKTVVVNDFQLLCEEETLYYRTLSIDKTYSAALTCISDFIYETEKVDAL